MLLIEEQVSSMRHQVKEAPSIIPMLFSEGGLEDSDTCIGTNQEPAG